MRRKGKRGPSNGRAPSVRDPLQKKDAVIGYLRVSSVDQAENGVSLAEQEHRIRGYCDAHGLTLVSVVSDEGISGKPRETDRVSNGR